MDTKPYAKKLEEEKKRLERELGSLGHRDFGRSGEWQLTPLAEGTEPDMADQADVATTQEGNASVLADLNVRYQAVVEALSRIEDGTYGQCAVCGKEISPERLAADPAATTCTEHL